MLHPGGVLLLYSDGILERPGRELPASTVKLAQVAADTGAGRCTPARPRRWSGYAPRAWSCWCAPPGTPTTSTLLAVQHVDFPADLDLRVAAEPSATRATRKALAHRLEEAGAGRDDALNLCTPPASSSPTPSNTVAPRWPCTPR